MNTKLKFNLSVFMIGAFGYTIIEYLWRGYTHWSMCITGGLCFVAMYHLYNQPVLSSWWKKCLSGALCITLIEFLVGCIVNLYLKWNVWDYSDRNFHLFGQVCLFYSILWFLLCFVAIPLVAFINKKLNNI